MEHLYQKILKYWDISSREWLYVASSPFYDHCIEIIEAPNELEAAYQVWLTCDLDSEQILEFFWKGIMSQDLDKLKKINNLLKSNCDIILFDDKIISQLDKYGDTLLVHDYLDELSLQLGQPDLGTIVKFTVEENMVTKEELRKYLKQERLVVTLTKLDDFRKKPILEQIDDSN